MMPVMMRVRSTPTSCQEKTSEHVSKECAQFVQSNTKVNGEWNLSFWFPIANNDVHKHGRLLL